MWYGDYYEPDGCRRDSWYLLGTVFLVSALLMPVCHHFDKIGLENKQKREAAFKVWKGQTETFSGFDFRHRDCALIPTEGTEIHYVGRRVVVITPQKEELVDISIGDCNNPTIFK